MTCFLLIFLLECAVKKLSLQGLFLTVTITEQTKIDICVTFMITILIFSHIGKFEDELQAMLFYRGRQEVLLGETEQVRRQK